MLKFEWSSNLHLFLNPVWDGLVITHLPEGPTLHFKLSSIRLTTEIKVSDNNLFQFWLLLAEQCITEVTLICWGYIFMDFEIDLLQNPKKKEFFYFLQNVNFSKSMKVDVQKHKIIFWFTNKCFTFAWFCII